MAFSPGVSGKYAQVSQSGQLFFGSTLIAGVALPVMAATLASKFTIWNPPASTKLVELVELGLGITSATTVVNGIGMAIMPHVSTQSSGAPTAPTIAAGANNATVGYASSSGGVNVFGTSSIANLYTALTLTNAAVWGPTLWLRGGFGAITDASIAPDAYNFDGKIFLPPDTLATFITDVAAETAMALSLTWIEW